MANLVSRSYAFSSRQLQVVRDVVTISSVKELGHSESLDLAYNKSFQGQNTKCNTMHLPVAYHDISRTALIFALL